MLVAQNSLGPVCPVPLTVRGTAQVEREDEPREREEQVQIAACFWLSSFESSHVALPLGSAGGERSLMKPVSFGAKRGEETDRQGWKEACKTRFFWETTEKREQNSHPPFPRTPSSPRLRRRRGGRALDARVARARREDDVPNKPHGARVGHLPLVWEEAELEEVRGDPELPVSNA